MPSMVKAPEATVIVAIPFNTMPRLTFKVKAPSERKVAPSLISKDPAVGIAGTEPKLASEVI